MHVIRLRKPWTKLVGEGVPAMRVDVPDQSATDLVMPGTLVCYSRRFNRPSRLDDARVHLRITGWRGALTALRLNGKPISVSDSSTCVNADITSLIAANNELVVVIAGTSASPPQLSGEVTLGIEETSLS